MGLLQKLKSALGLDGAQSPEPGTATPRDVDVTVEREPSSESEDAVKGTETASSDAGGSTEPDPGEVTPDDSSHEETPVEEAEPSVDASGSALDEAEPAVDEAEPAVDADESDTSGESVEPDESDADEVEAPDEPAEESAAESTGEAADLSDDPVTELTGIGPAYGQRLSDAGVDTVADLAGADADELEAATDISASRIEGWIDAATEY